MSAQERRVVHEHLRIGPASRRIAKAMSRTAASWSHRSSPSERRPHGRLLTLPHERRWRRSRAARGRAGFGQLGNRSRQGLEGARRRQPHRARHLRPARGIEDRRYWLWRRGFRALPSPPRCPKARVDLIESIGRKCEFIQRAIDATGIANAQVIKRSLGGSRSGRRSARPTLP